MPFAFLSVLASAAPALAPGGVGETRHVDAAPAPAPEIDGMKLSFRLPDTIPFPADNPYTPEKAWLGRMLFNDPRLSRSGEVACATCHNPGFGYGDGKAQSIAKALDPRVRRSPSIVGSA